MSDTTPVEMLQAIEDFLKASVLPKLDGFEGYNLKVAINSLKIVQRDLALQGELDALDLQASAQIKLPSGDEDFRQSLSIAIRDGVIEINDDMIEYLKQRTMKKLSIDNPKYSGYQEALRRWR